MSSTLFLVNKKYLARVVSTKLQAKMLSLTRTKPIWKKLTVSTKKHGHFKYMPCSCFQTHVEHTLTMTLVNTYKHVQHTSNMDIQNWISDETIFQLDHVQYFRIYKHHTASHSEDYFISSLRMKDFVNK